MLLLCSDTGVSAGAAAAGARIDRGGPGPVCLAGGGDADARRHGLAPAAVAVRGAQCLHQAAAARHEAA